MKYSLKDLRSDFPDNDACLEWLMNYRFPNGVFCVECDKVTKHYKLKGLPKYNCGRCNKQISPMAGTIFEKSRTPLTDWFHAMWMMSADKSGTSAAQIQRELGVTYKTAFRMMHKIRELMAPDDEPLKGEVEIDETFVHANVFKRSSAKLRYGLTGNRSGDVIFGLVERGGRVKVFHTPTAGQRILVPIIQKHVAPGTLIHSDGYLAYRKLPMWGYPHRWTDHGKGQFWTEDSYTQNIENVWSHLKRGIKGVYRSVSSRHLEKYAWEYAWRYSHRGDVSMFWSLMGEVDK